ncbi:MAG: hypothetical protein COT85_02200 [Chlamydiae bacterium CG10_big_fil_rev_8_21_14_0_10_42_34]|nr:MAG: hypothetical protein COT85_02200 [Chlamydiae bacterium CG10_big_fil_rev_8_21_14_0_10_42_34]
MGNISTILAALLCAAAPIGSVEMVDSKKSMSQADEQSGKQVVSLVRKAYQNGDYNQFFKEMDGAFSHADLDGFIQMRAQDIPLEFQLKWEQRFTDLQELKNKDLLDALSSKDRSVFAEKVRSIASNISTPEQQKAISKLNSFITMAPNTGANEDENTLIKIDLEYEYKLYQSQFPTSDTSTQQRHYQQIALRMQKMDKMLEASKSFKDQFLKRAVLLASKNLDSRLARNLDGADLNALVKGKVKPTTELEEKVYSIISSYQGQFNDLMKNLNSVYR